MVGKGLFDWLSTVKLDDFPRASATSKDLSCMLVRANFGSLWLFREGRFISILPNRHKMSANTAAMRVFHDKNSRTVVHQVMKIIVL